MPRAQATIIFIFSQPLWNIARVRNSIGEDAGNLKVGHCKIDLGQKMPTDTT
jgi:hypothetical protein